MQINLDNVIFSGEKLAEDAVKRYINIEQSSCPKLTAEKCAEIISKYSKENILNTEHSYEILNMFITGCFLSYHEQLRNVLLSQSVDIGELDITAPGSYRMNLMKKVHEADDNE
ncbi:MAG: hypothetical protein HFJ89_11275 [Oscillospiraceae bacterium]|jgi:hypothetical protein|nr:hypothetical protein [Oscillospiraceae bacterium]